MTSVVATNRLHRHTHHAKPTVKSSIPRPGWPCLPSRRQSMQVERRANYKAGGGGRVFHGRSGILWLLAWVLLLRGWPSPTFCVQVYIYQVDTVVCCFFIRQTPFGQTPLVQDCTNFRLEPKGSSLPEACVQDCTNENQGADDYAQGLPGTGSASARSRRPQHGQAFDGSWSFHHEVAYAH